MHAMVAVMLFALQTAAPPPGRGLPMPPLVKLASLSAAERQTLGASTEPPTVGVHRALDAGVVKKGKWKKVGPEEVWRVAVESPGARSVRLRLEDFDLGRGRLWVCGKAPDPCYGPYTGKGPNGDKAFWSDVVDGDTAIVELALPRKVKALPFRLARLAHQIR